VIPGPELPEIEEENKEEAEIVEERIFVEQARRRRRKLHSLNGKKSTKKAGE